MGSVRTCIGCRRRRPMEELARVARGPAGSLVVDRTLPGRGAWLCRGSVACMDRAIAKRAFDRALRVRLSEGQIDRDGLVAGLSGSPWAERGSEAPPR